MKLFSFTASAEEIASLKALESEWGSEFWTTDEILKTFHASPSFFQYAKGGTEWEGLIFALEHQDAFEILYIFTAKNYRKKGLGKELLNALQKYATKKKIYLEVKANNQSALNLYISCGFHQTGKRKGYYRDGQDAILMEWRP